MKFIDNIKNIPVGNSIEGDFLVKEVSEVNCANGTLAYFLTLANPNGDYKAKIWDSYILFSGLNANIIKSSSDLVSKAISIKGLIKEYKGVHEISVTSCVVYADGEVDITDFMQSLNYHQIQKDFTSVLKRNCSDEVMGALGVVLNRNGTFDRFMKGVAAVSHHDAIIGGLINHTTKMLKILEVVVSNDTALIPYKDILFLGCALHDIGKIYEYTELGGYAPLGFVDHKAFGIEMLTECKSEMLKYISEDVYYRTVSIILGHHGEFGERPHTIYAKIIHLIDMLDSQTTGIMEAVSQVTPDKNGSSSIRYDGGVLAI